jgi:hypothetical protein
MLIDYEVNIACKPEELFPWVAEPDKAMMWMKSVRKGEIIEETPEKTGTTFREEMEEGGKILEMSGVITGYIENKLIAFHLESKIHEVDVSYTIEPLGDRSRLLVMSTIEWKFPMNMISLIIGRKIRSNITNQLESEFADLRKLCEQ